MNKNKTLTLLATALLGLFIFGGTAEAASHKVSKGDTLYAISKKVGVTVDQIKSANKLKSNTIKIGQNLVIPSTKVETKVQSKVQTVVKTKVENKTVSNNVKEFKVTATSYTASCKGCSGITKTGINLIKNPDMKVIAVDPKVIPLGTKVWVEGYGMAVAGDIGSAIKGNKIDVFIPNKNQALKWGRKTVTVKVYM